ncbi:hypothetical protein ACH4VR_40205 [Streptomyces sp. NPDC020883]|uniref:hypothetical protein n=1 Tax=Streptomyces sp. NPDC020883 TaxID=3365099 RepID=UPI00379BEC93
MNPPNDWRKPDPIRDASELAWEAATARVQDANLSQLRQQDPDADRLFPPGAAFTKALVDDGSRLRLGNALAAYGAAKHSADRMELFRQLFAGTGDDAIPYNG